MKKIEINKELKKEIGNIFDNNDKLENRIVNYLTKKDNDTLKEKEKKEILLEKEILVLMTNKNIYTMNIKDISELIKEIEKNDKENLIKRIKNRSFIETLTEEEIENKRKEENIYYEKDYTNIIYELEIKIFKYLKIKEEKVITIFFDLINNIELILEKDN